jgi:hypothetical protein
MSTVQDGRWKMEDGRLERGWKGWAAGGDERGRGGAQMNDWVRVTESKAKCRSFDV